jgi:two-component sensor histidine kinase
MVEPSWIPLRQTARSRDRPHEEPLANHAEQLLAEMRHRVANDLALIAGMLELQRGDHPALAAADVLDKTIGCLVSLAVYYRRLYETPRETDLLDLERHLAELVDALRTAYLDRLGIDVDCRLHSVLVPAPMARDLGIIIVELVANAAKHAFAGKAGRIGVEIYETPGGLLCRVSDDGRGLVDGARARPNGGLVAARRLAARLGGSLVAGSSPRWGGAAFSLEIPWAADAAARSVSND